MANSLIYCEKISSMADNTLEIKALKDNVFQEQE